MISAIYRTVRPRVVDGQQGSLARGAHGRALLKRQIGEKLDKTRWKLKKRRTMCSNEKEGMYEIVA